MEAAVSSIHEVADPPTGQAETGFKFSGDWDVYALALVLLMVLTMASFQQGQASRYADVIASKGTVAAEQMLIEHQSAVSAIAAATPAAFTPGQVGRDWITPQEPSWFQAGANFTSYTDGVSLVVTVYPGDTKLWQPMAAVLSKEQTATVPLNINSANKATTSGVIGIDTSGPFLQVQPQQTIPVKVSLPAGAFPGVQAGMPALVTAIQ